MVDILPDTILPNGAKVLDTNNGVVLASWDKPSGKEYITWVYDDDMNCFDGHYFNYFESAVKDFDNRKNNV